VEANTDELYQRQKEFVTAKRAQCSI